MAKKPAATRDTKHTHAKKDSRIQTTVAYRTARIARARQKREIEMQKREKLIFALIVVTILVMIIFAILIFKKVLGNEPRFDDTVNDTHITDTVTDPDNTQGVENTEIDAQPITVNVDKSALYKGSLILIDSEHPNNSSAPALKIMSESRTVFGTNSNGKNIVSYYVASMTETLLEEKALEAFNAFADDYYKATDNVDLYVSKAYAEGDTNHSMGTLVDLRMWLGNDTFFNIDDAKYTSEYEWIMSNCYKYGFIPNADTDHGHCFRYVGIPHAVYMQSHSIGLKDYVALLKRENLTITTDSGEKYEVYYINFTGDVVSIPIPSADTSYDISGDNSGGLIVTVKVK